MLNGLDLFSGIGGIALALAPWVRPVAYCEIDPYAQGVLLSQMGEGAIPLAPVWDDVQTLTGAQFPQCIGPIDIITGGFPCQDISVAGHGKGLGGERSGLFWEIIRLCGELGPRFVFLENVSAITARDKGGTEVVGAFASLGYACRWATLSASQVGANHKRDRWWLLAHATGIPSGGLPIGEEPAESRPPCGGQNVANTDGSGLQEKGSQQQATGTQYRGIPDPSGERLEEWEGPPREWPHPSIMRADWWAVEPDVGRVAHGIPHRVDRIKGLGNAVVPLQARRAFEILMGMYGGKDDGR